MSFEITGKLVQKAATQQVTENFKKREFVLELNEQGANGNTFTNFAKLQLVQGKCEVLDRFNEGDQLKVNFNLRGNKWEKDGRTNYITNLDAWRIEPANNNDMNTQAPPFYNNYNQAPQQNYQQAPSAPFANSGDVADDLPF